jgi:hypothetical protein
VSDFVQIRQTAVPDARGTLIIAQDDFPFDIRRVFWVVGAGGQTRGGHRHHVTRQALVAIQGSVAVHLDDGRHQSTISLGSPSLALLVEPEDWHTMDFSSDAVLLVFASHAYDRTDYIHDPY